MISLFSSFNRAVRAMQASQHATAVNASNIANANNPTYTRRELLPQGETNVRGPGIIRVRDAFVDDQYRKASSSLGEGEIRRNIMSKVEDIFGDPVNGGLRTAIDQFFDGWKGLAENATDGVARIQVLSAGRMFSQQIKSVHEQLSAVEQTVNEELVTRVDDVNTALAKIYDLNKRISELHRHQLDDAALRDERDATLDKLAKLTGAYPIEQPDATVRVIIGPTPVIDGPTLAKLKLVETDQGPVPTWDAYDNPVFGGGGTVTGLVAARNGEIQKLKSDIDRLGKAVAERVNELHRAGTGIGGVTGLDFFIIGDGPADIIVNPNLRADQLPAGDGSGLPADGDNARKLAAVGEEPLLESVIIPGQMQSPRVFYRNLVGWIGAKAQDAVQLESISATHVQVSDQQRQSQWGVSMDEEVASLTIQQKAFGAAARIISVMDEMLDTLINRT